jgi:predicted outer membrane repeat protein
VPNRKRRGRLWLEPLEARFLPSTVTNLSDGDPGSLRDAIATTPAGGTVDFQPGLTGTITLTTGELDVNQDLTIEGPGASVITVSGNNASRVFNIGKFTVAISGLTIADGTVTDLNGGGLYNAGTLTVSDSAFGGNSAVKNHSTSPKGGGIYSTGTLGVIETTFSGNSAYFYGGAIGTTGSLNVINSTFSGNLISGPNVSGSGGGGIENEGTLTVTNSTFSGNSAASKATAR